MTRGAGQAPVPAGNKPHPGPVPSSFIWPPVATGLSLRLRCCLCGGREVADAVRGEGGCGEGARPGRSPSTRGRLAVPER